MHAVHETTAMRRPRAWHIAVVATGIGAGLTAAVGGAQHGTYIAGTSGSYTTVTSLSPTVKTSQPPVEWESTGVGGYAAYESCLREYANSPDGRWRVERYCARQFPTETAVTPRPVTSTSMVPTTKREWQDGTPGHTVTTSSDAAPVGLLGISTAIAAVLSLVLMSRRWRQVRSYRRDAADARTFARTYPPGAEGMCSTDLLQRFATAARSAAHTVFADRLHWQAHSVQQCEQQAAWYREVGARANAAYESRLGGGYLNEAVDFDDDEVVVTPMGSSGSDLPVDIDSDDGEF
jgi:hypothetical protein